jgi:hypothetical protein
MTAGGGAALITREFTNLDRPSHRPLLQPSHAAAFRCPIAALARTNSIMEFDSLQQARNTSLLVFVI